MQNFPGVQLTVAGYRRPQSARVRSIYAKQGVDGIEESCRRAVIWETCVFAEAGYWFAAVGGHLSVKYSQQNQEILKSWIIGIGGSS